MGRKLNTLVVIDNLHTGGVASSLYNYLKYTCQFMRYDLLVFNEDSVDYRRLPPNVNVIKPQRILHLLGKNQKEMREESFILALIRGFLFLLARLFNGQMARNLLWLFVKSIGNYDYSVAYAQDDGWKSLSKGCLDFVLKKVYSRKKSVVIHCDYKHFGGFHPNQIKSFQQLDFVICVSESCRRSFLECFPSLSFTTIVCENFTDTVYIQEQAGPGESYDKSIMRFVTVCRISKVKGLERVVSAIKKLVVNGYHGFHWVVVGDGPEKEVLAKQIAENELAPYVTLVGEKKNPYPYIKNASWFILPSYHEAAPMVFGESVALSVPVLSTETCSAMELLENRGWGVVVDNSEDGIYGGLTRILSGELASFTIKESNVNRWASLQIESLISCFS